MQDASCQAGGCEVTGRLKLLLSTEYEWSQSYGDRNQHPCPPGNFVTHTFLHPSAFAEIGTLGLHISFRKGRSRAIAVTAASELGPPLPRNKGKYSSELGSLENHLNRTGPSSFPSI